MNDQVIQAIRSGDTFQDPHGRTWRMPEGTRPYLDTKSGGMQGRWIAVLTRRDSDGTRRAMTLSRATPISLKRS